LTCNFATYQRMVTQICVKSSACFGTSDFGSRTVDVDRILFEPFERFDITAPRLLAPEPKGAAS
jgi:hypothetical protein